MFDSPDLPAEEPPEPPPPPLLVPAAAELARFGWAWTGLALALAAVAVASGGSAELDRGEGALVATLLVLSLGGVFGALLLARRTGPEILYYRILDRAPPPPRGVPLEPAGATTRRVVAPALALVLGLLATAAFGVAVVLLVGGEPREELGRDVPGGALIVAAGWTLASGVAALQVGSYFRRWQRRRDALVLCRPLKAGTMRPVYWVVRAERP